MKGGILGMKKSQLEYSNCYDEMAWKDLAVFGVCTGKVKIEDDGKFVEIDCVHCPYWVSVHAPKKGVIV